MWGWRSKGVCASRRGAWFPRFALCGTRTRRRAPLLLVWLGKRPVVMGIVLSLWKGGQVGGFGFVVVRGGRGFVCWWYARAGKVESE